MSHPAGTKMTRTCVRVLCAAGCLALACSLTVSAVPGGAAASAHRSAAGRAADLAVTGLGETDGYHLFRASSATGWAWRSLAVLAPGGDDGERWIGQQCVTGDGRIVVAVVAPWHVNNSPALQERGATAVAVDLSSGKARVLASGVAMYYFNPGCGTGSDVALTRYLGADQQVTQVLRVSAATGRVVGRQTVTGEVTSAVPLAGSVAAIWGSRLVRLAGDKEQTVASLPGTGFDLRANAVGGVDLLTYGLASKVTTAWRWSASGLNLLDRTSRPGVSLSGGADGRTMLNVSGSSPAAGLSAAPVAAAPADGFSLDGSAELTAPPKTSADAADMLPGIDSLTGRVLRPSAYPPAPGAGATVLTSATPADPAAAAPAGNSPRRSTLSATPATSPCSVPRLDIYLQVPQPSNDQVNWAVQQAVINALPTRNLTELGGSYNPETDFPQEPLLPSAAGAHVPALLVDAILAQESNWDQASFHAPPGMAGDPLIADYYGNGGYPIDYSNSDCGYGIGQVTSGMRTNAGYPLEVQQRVAVDYAENIAAAVHLLSVTWDQLYQLGIIVNNGDPNWLENWYDTIWAYNSGLQPNSDNGNSTGCSPGPSCTDGSGNWGLGWANNPINPIYPANRGVFLQDANGYADAATPQYWPYQEKVFGWMSTSLIRSVNGTTTVDSAYVPAPAALNQPELDAFCSSADNCQPGAAYQSVTYPQQPPGACLLDDLHCWWHQSVSIPIATPASMSEIAGVGEPSATDPEPPTCNADYGTIAPPSARTGSDRVTIVTDESQGTQNQDVNIEGCPGAPANWSVGGTFTVSNVWDSSGNPMDGQVDFHQLGAGFGGHMWFTHQVASSDTGHIVTATWQPDLSALGQGVYRIYVFVPDIGATAQAVYTVNNGASQSFLASVNQNNASGWVDIGAYHLSPGANVQLSNAASAAGTSDLAFNAVAFTKVAGTGAWVAMGDSYSSGNGAPPL